MRMSREVVGDVVLVNDAYNANPRSMEAAILELSARLCTGRRVMVLGDMLELGQLSAELHHEVGRLAADAALDQLILVGDLTRATAAGALEAGMSPDRVLHFDDVDEGIARAPGLVREGDVVLIKGSRATGLDRLVERLAGE